MVVEFENKFILNLSLTMIKIYVSKKVNYSKNEVKNNHNIDSSAQGKNL